MGEWKQMLSGEWPGTWRTDQEVPRRSREEDSVTRSVTVKGGTEKLMPAEMPKRRSRVRSGE